MGNSNPTPLQIAAKIHFFLMRELGQGIDMKQMLERRAYARDVLLVCDACRGTELAELARQFRAATADTPALQAAPGHTRRPLDWAADTSGFGDSRVAAEPPAEPTRSWFARLLSR